MLRSEWSESKLKAMVRHRGVAPLCLAAALVFACASVPTAAAQGTSEFTLQAASFSPDAVAPGGTSSSAITVGSVNGFAGTVNLSCQVSPADSTITDPPTCTVSPASVTAPATATATVTTKVTTTTVAYGVTITGTGPTTTFTTGSIPLTVLAVTPQFTITVSSAVAPNSVPAGNGAQGIVTVTPIAGYISPSGGPSAGVTLACASITPLVTIAPVCSFSYPSGFSSLIVSGTPATSTLTISTFGPVTTRAAAHSRDFYGLWFALPILGIVGLGAAASGKRSRKAWGVLALFVLGGSLILIPSCGNNNGTSSTTPNGVTPPNTYSFTIVGVDSKGVVSSNTSSTTSAGPTVSLTVTAPPKTP